MADTETRSTDDTIHGARHVGQGASVPVPRDQPVLHRRDVERIRNISYGPHGRANLLDLYRPRSPKPAKGVLVQLHGDGFFSGRKSKEARLLLERLAADG